MPILLSATMRLRGMDKIALCLPSSVKGSGTCPQNVSVSRR